MVSSVRSNTNNKQVYFNWLSLWIKNLYSFSLRLGVNKCIIIVNWKFILSISQAKGK